MECTELSTGASNRAGEHAQEATRALLVGVEPHDSPGSGREAVAELIRLVDTLGLAVVGQVMVRVRRPGSRYLVGSGKAQEIVDKAAACRAEVIIFDEALTPSQQRNWEKLSELAVIDRQEVILDIFAARAHTREAVLQVKLAQAEYELPRLKRRWTHLSRQRGMRGGMGLRGEGEQQIEVDYRLVKKRIAQLRGELDQVRLRRSVQRGKRTKKPVPVAAIVGYTNAGKSSLLNALTNAEVLVEDKLFATLDPTIRRIGLPNNQDLLLCDTVGFIRKLPHLLVEAFKATLEETRVADFLIEVLDAEAGELDAHHETTREVLRELGADRTPVVTVLNKVDLIPGALALRRLQRRYPDAVLVSAATGDGLTGLRERLASELNRLLREVDLLVPHDRYDVVDTLHRTSRILQEKYEPEGVRLTVAVPASLMGLLRDFLVTN